MKKTYECLFIVLYILLIIKIKTKNTINFFGKINNLLDLKQQLDKTSIELIKDQTFDKIQEAIITMHTIEKSNKNWGGFIKTNILKTKEFLDNIKQNDGNILEEMVPFTQKTIIIGLTIRAIKNLFSIFFLEKNLWIQKTKSLSIENDIHDLINNDLNQLIEITNKMSHFIYYNKFYKKNVMDTIKIISKEQFEEFNKSYINIETNIMRTIIKIKNKMEQINKDTQKLSLEYKNKKYAALKESIVGWLTFATNLVGPMIPYIGDYIENSRTTTIVEMFYSGTNLGLSFFWGALYDQTDSQLEKIKNLYENLSFLENKTIEYQNNFKLFNDKYNIIKNTKTFKILKILYKTLNLLIITINLFFAFLSNNFIIISFITIIFFTTYAFKNKLKTIFVFRKSQKNEELINIVKNLLLFFFVIILEYICFVLIKDYNITKEGLLNKEKNDGFVVLKIKIDRYNKECKWVEIPFYRQFYLTFCSIFQDFRSITFDDNGFLISDHHCNELKTEIGLKNNIIKNDSTPITHILINFKILAKIISSIFDEFFNTMIKNMEYFVNNTFLSTKIICLLLCFLLILYLFKSR